MDASRPKMRRRKDVSHDTDKDEGPLNQLITVSYASSVHQNSTFLNHGIIHQEMRSELPIIRMMSNQLKVGG